MLAQKKFYTACFCVLLLKGCGISGNANVENTYREDLRQDPFANSAQETSINYLELWSEEDFIRYKNRDRSADDAIPQFHPSKLTDKKEPVQNEESRPVPILQEDRRPNL